MFKNLNNLEIKRSWKEAVVFYIVYLIATLIIGVVLTVFAAIIFNVTPENAKDFGIKVGTGMAIVISTFLTYYILKKKGILKEPSSLAYIFATCVFSGLGGALLGLIIPSFLTTESVKNNLETKNENEPTVNI